MPKYEVHLFHRESGKETARIVEAPTEREAMLSTGDDQHVVGRVALKGPTDAELEADLAMRRAAEAAAKAESERIGRAKQAKRPAIDRITPLRRPLRSMRMFSFVLCLLGGLTTLGALAMNTTNGGVHNVGLLNQQTSFVMIGCVMALAGFISLAIGEAAGVVCNVLAGIHDISVELHRMER